MTNLISLERKIVETEYFFTKIELIPILGTVGAIGKVGLGILQMFGACWGIFFSTPFLLFSEARAILKRSFSHLLNGTGNIIAGVIEAIPLVGMMVVGYRVYRAISEEDQKTKTFTGQEHNLFLGYKILEENPNHPEKNIQTTSPLINI